MKYKNLAISEPVHRRLRLLAADTGRPLREIAEGLLLQGMDKEGVLNRTDLDEVETPSQATTPKQ